MKAQYLGHVVFYVKDLQRSLAFYRDLLGLSGSRDGSSTAPRRR
jgi:catechol 2,3-dioxygenase-like lactoylglutathione lyase family enzyme